MSSEIITVILHQGIQRDALCSEGLICETKKCVGKEEQRLIKGLVRDRARNKSFFICPK